MSRVLHFIVLILRVKYKKLDITLFFKIIKVYS
jgi:hypothetical protein